MADRDRRSGRPRDGVADADRGHARSCTPRWCAPSGRPAPRPGTRRSCCADGTIEGFVGGDVRGVDGARAGAATLLDAGEPLLLRIAPGDAGEPPSRPRTGRRRAQPVPVRRRAGDLPRAGGAGAASCSCSATPRSRARWRGSARPLGYDGRALTTAGAAARRRDGRGRRLARPRRGAGARAPRCGAGVPYVGLVASRSRGAAVLGVARPRRRRAARAVHTPAGLDIGARTAAGDRAVDPGRDRRRRPRPRGGRATARRPRRVGAADAPSTRCCGMTVAAVDGVAARCDRRRRRGCWFCGTGCRTRRRFAADPYPS